MDKFSLVDDSHCGMACRDKPQVVLACMCSIRLEKLVEYVLNIWFKAYRKLRLLILNGPRSKVQPCLIKTANLAIFNLEQIPLRLSLSIINRNFHNGNRSFRASNLIIAHEQTHRKFHLHEPGSSSLRPNLRLSTGQPARNLILPDLPSRPRHPRIQVSQRCGH
jgi:hypothetical protein